jgi:hypothetical protein
VKYPFGRVAALACLVLVAATPSSAQFPSLLSGAFQAVRNRSGMTQIAMTCILILIAYVLALIGVGVSSKMRYRKAILSALLSVGLAVVCAGIGTYLSWPALGRLGVQLAPAESGDIRVGGVIGLLGVLGLRPFWYLCLFLLSALCCSSSSSEASSLKIRTTAGSWVLAGLTMRYSGRGTREGLCFLCQWLMRQTPLTDRDLKPRRSYRDPRLRGIEPTTFCA